MARCPECGAPFSDSSHFCSYCGVALDIVDGDTGREILDETRQVRGTAEEILQRVGGADPFANSPLLVPTAYRPFARVFAGAQVMAKAPRVKADERADLDLYVEDAEGNYAISQHKFEQLYEDGDVVEWIGGFLRDGEGHRYHITRAVDPDAPGSFGLGAWHRCPYCLLEAAAARLKSEFEELELRAQDVRARSGVPKRGVVSLEAMERAGESGIIESRLGEMSRRLHDIEYAMGQASPLIADPLVRPQDREQWVLWLAPFFEPIPPPADMDLEVSQAREQAATEFAAKAAASEGAFYFVLVIFGLIVFFGMGCWIVNLLNSY